MELPREGLLWGSVETERRPVGRAAPVLPSEQQGEVGRQRASGTAPPLCLSWTSWLQVTEPQLKCAQANQRTDWLIRPRVQARLNQGNQNHTKSWPLALSRPSVLTAGAEGASSLSGQDPSSCSAIYHYSTARAREPLSQSATGIPDSQDLARIVGSP